MYLHMTAHLRNIRCAHTIWRASHAVMIYTASNCNIKVVFTSSLKQDTFEHMMSYTYLPLQLLPTGIYSNIRIYTLQIPKSGKTATHVAWHKGTVPRAVGAQSPSYTQSCGHAPAALQRWAPAGKVLTRGHGHQ